MIESLENSFQNAVLLFCTAVALYRAFRQRSRTWTLLAFFCGSWLLGDLYWLVCLLYYDQTPQIKVVSDLSWYAGCVFLYLLLREAAPPERDGRARLLSWMGPVFAAAMAAYYYIQWGSLLSNVIYAALMGLLFYASVQRLAERGRYGNQRALCAVTLVFCLLEYGLWTASCFWWEVSLRNPYFWFDIAQSVCLFFFLPATRKAVAA